MPEESMKLEDYLAQGGVLTSPVNVTPRYRAELMRMMASFVDSELAGAAGFADMINKGPGVKERIAAAKIVLEKTDHAGQVLKLMGEFGANTDHYATHHAWTDRLSRDAPIGAERTTTDMRLAVFNYPLTGWIDSVAMNLLMGIAVGVQMPEYEMISYQPFAEAIRRIAPVEAHHTELAVEGVTKLMAAGDSKELQLSVNYWAPRVALSFGNVKSSRFDMLKSMGLRHQQNSELRNGWMTEAKSVVTGLNLVFPEIS